MRSMITGILILLCAAVVYAEFKDYRSFNQNQTPEQFEATMALSSIYPYSVTIFSQNHQLMWEATEVTDYIINGNTIEAIVQDDIALFADGSCGGLVVPKDTLSISLSGDFMVATTSTTHHLYYISECAQYQRVPNYGLYTDINNRFLCDASLDTYYIRDIHSGDLIYTAPANDRISAVHAGMSTCLYMLQNGDVIEIGSDFQPTLVTYIEEPIYGMSTFSKGFMGLTSSYFFTITLDEYGSIGIDFEPLPKNGFCLLTKDSPVPFCEAHFMPEFTEIALSVDKISITEDTIYTQTDDLFQAYDRALGWVKSLVTTYEIPTPCVDGENVYYNDLFGNIWSVGLYGNGSPQAVASGYPQMCDGGAVYYRDGSFFMDDHRFVYRYAEIIQQDNGRLMLKHAEKDRVLYFIVNE